MTTYSRSTRNSGYRTETRHNARNTSKVVLAAAGAVALALAWNNVASSEGDAQKLDHSVEAAISAHDGNALAGLELKQLQGSVAVNPNTHVRNEPIKNEPGAGETNDAAEYTDATKDEASVVILEDPLVYESTDGSGETWYGAKSTDSSDYFWVEASGTKPTDTRLYNPDIDLTNVIYISPSRESNP